MSRIKSILEAFSMQPGPLTVRKSPDGYYDPQLAIKEIRLESVIINGDPYECYCGYNFDGKKLFQYHAKSVNVHYFPE